MVNEFRVLLSNLPYQSTTPGDHLARGFNGLVLPNELGDFRRVLSPDSMTRDAVLFATQNLVNVVSSTTMRDQIVKYDSRLTYSADANGDYFTATRVSLPNVSNSFFPLFVYGDFTPVGGRYKEDIRVSQLANTLAVRVFSGISGQVFIPSLTLDFDSNHQSQAINLEGMGMTLKIGGTNGSFVATSGKTWQVFIEAPQSYDTLGVYNLVKSNQPVVAKMLAQKPYEDTSSFEAEWRNNPNTIYKLAALLVCYVSRVKKLIT